MVISFHRKPNDMQCYQIHYNFRLQIYVWVWIKYVRIRWKWLLTLALFRFVCLLTSRDIHNFNFFFSGVKFFREQNLPYFPFCCAEQRFHSEKFHKVYCVARIICFSSISLPHFPFASLSLDKETTNFRCFHADVEANQMHRENKERERRQHSILECAGIGVLYLCVESWHIDGR